MGEAFLRIASSPLFEEIARLTEEKWGSHKRASPTISSPLPRIRKQWKAKLGDKNTANIERRLPHLFFPWLRPPPVEIAGSRELVVA